MLRKSTRRANTDVARRALSNELWVLDRWFGLIKSAFIRKRLEGMFGRFTSHLSIHTYICAHTPNYTHVLIQSPIHPYNYMHARMPPICAPLPLTVTRTLQRVHNIIVIIASEFHFEFISETVIDERLNYCDKIFLNKTFMIHVLLIN